ncbi:ATP synthase F0 subunit C [Myxococcota bacterium]|nr:ATP synthase F0 subunit C [Myxococcota bacterium]MBU1380658.1 ATP synthase F0 subunit C [Myxococcota bacterium]MBU1495866.1 ATP synthase F0 subunit C [Myxococcota bacterium]
MTRLSKIILIILISTFSFGTMAQSKQETADDKNTAASSKKDDVEIEKVKIEGKSKEKVTFEFVGVIPLAIAIGFGAIAMAIVGGLAVAGIARNPGAKAQVQTVMILAMVFIESLAIYALLVTFMYYAKL